VVRLWVDDSPREQNLLVEWLAVKRGTDAGGFL
jgi:hypothetical protein